ncbi:MAG: ABC transporter permease [Lachnospiraceae bacterium]|nr:ABC transporter permease [Lachnospiraceae bacterium]
MRKINVIKGDMVFQWKYGFYLLYFILIVIYLSLFSYLSGSVRDTIVTICVYSDPAAMGMFFMGALILLEKSQRVINSLAVSPVNVGEYILGKVISIGLISLVVGLVLISQGHTDSLLLSCIGIFAGSVLFSLCGILVGTKVDNVNQYIVATLPFEIVGFVPVIFYRIGFLWDNLLMLLHPGCAVVRLIEGDRGTLFPALISVLVWIIVLYQLALRATKRMFRTAGGVKL